MTLPMSQLFPLHSAIIFFFYDMKGLYLHDYLYVFDIKPM